MDPRNSKTLKSTCRSFLGKMNRGLTVAETLRILKRGEPLSEEEIFKANLLGWCIEWVCSLFFQWFVLDHLFFADSHHFLGTWPPIAPSFLLGL